MPHRAPGTPGTSPKSFLSGKTIRYYRPRGSADITRLIDEGFQAFNAARLGEACRIYSDKMLAPSHDTTIGLTIAGAQSGAEHKDDLKGTLGAGGKMLRLRTGDGSIRLKGL